MTEVKKRCSWRSDKVYSWQIDGLVCTRGGVRVWHKKRLNIQWRPVPLLVPSCFACTWTFLPKSHFSQHLHFYVTQKYSVDANYQFILSTGAGMHLVTGKTPKWFSFVCDHMCCTYKGIHVNTCKNISWPPLCKIPISNFLDARCHGLAYLLKWDHKTSITIWQTS